MVAFGGAFRFTFRYETLVRFYYEELVCRSRMSVIDLADTVLRASTRSTVMTTDENWKGLLA